MDEKVVDAATTRRDENTLPKDELSLPLTSISFKAKAKQPSLIGVAKVLRSVSVVGGKYNFYDKICL
jgi:hypothetical protein